VTGQGSSTAYNPFAMVKRPDTPPPAEDAERILCVTFPYPEVEPIDFEADSGVEVILSQWLAQFIKKESLFDIYWMPRSDKILISVAREQDGFYNNILGEHRWGAFLKTCPKENEARVSTVYYSTFRHARDVQKHGWRQKWIEASWFEDDYSTSFRQPYPDPTYTSDVADLCRPIPAPKGSATGPIVGTSEWMAASAPRVTPGAPTTHAAFESRKKQKKKKNAGQVGSLSFV